MFGVHAAQSNMPHKVSHPFGTDLGKSAFYSPLGKRRTCNLLSSIEREGSLEAGQLHH